MNKEVINGSHILEDQTLGQYIRSLRHQKSWTQNELCERSDIKFTYLSKIENDKANSPSEELLIRIAVALNENPYRMLIRAGKVPTDFQNVILTDEETYQFLESKTIKRKAR
jgi:transcriptional regulator with XRE-family HTH domain